MVLPALLRSCVISLYGLEFRQHRFRELLNSQQIRIDRVEGTPSESVEQRTAMDSRGSNRIHHPKCWQRGAAGRENLRTEGDRPQSEDHFLGAERMAG